MQKIFETIENETSPESREACSDIFGHDCYIHEEWCFVMYPVHGAPELYGWVQSSFDQHQLHYGPTLLVRYEVSLDAIEIVNQSENWNIWPVETACDVVLAKCSFLQTTISEGSEAKLVVLHLGPWSTLHGPLKYQDEGLLAFTFHRGMGNMFTFVPSYFCDTRGLKHMKYSTLG